VFIFFQRKTAHSTAADIAAVHRPNTPYSQQCSVPR
jgi:hypothetical protein